MAVVSVFALSVEKVLDVGAAVGAGESDLEGLGGGAEAVGGGGAGVCDTEAGGGAGGLEPPMLREMVGGGAGASICSGRSKGAGGGSW